MLCEEDVWEQGYVPINQQEKKQEKKLTKKRPRSDSVAKIYIYLYIYIFNIKIYYILITEPVFALVRGLYFLL